VPRCDRCHHKFKTYSALAQHYRGVHTNARMPAYLEKLLVEEKEAKAAYNATLRPHGPSRIKIIAFVLIIVVAIGVTGYVAFAPKEASARKIGVGAVAPNFTLPNTAGGTFTLSAYRGKSNVLLFFNEGLSCAPCLKQMQDLDHLNPQFTELNVTVVSITGDPLNLLTDWARTSGPSYGEVLSDQSLQVSRAYDMLGADVSMMPGTAPGHSFVLVDKNGVIVWRGDYGPANMSVPNNEVIAAVRRALGG